MIYIADGYIVLYCRDIYIIYIQLFLKSDPFCRWMGLPRKAAGTHVIPQNSRQTHPSRHVEAQTGNYPLEIYECQLAAVATSLFEVWGGKNETTKQSNSEEIL